MRTLTKKIEKLGFPMVQDVAGMASIHVLIGTTDEEGRCGIYLLILASGEAYIGQSKNVVKRYPQHVKRWADIVGFAFIPTPSAHLDSEEKDCIERAERLKIPLLNSIFVSAVRGESKFDAIVSPQEQQQFLLNPTQTNLADKSPRNSLPDEQLINKKRQFESFLAHPHAKQALAVLELYINNCLPLPCRSEYSFWSLTCMPTYGREWKRMAVVNTSVMQLCVLSYNKVSGDAEGFFIVSRSILMQHYRSEKAFLRHYPDVVTLNSTFQAAGQDQILLCTNFPTMLRLLTDHAVLMAGADLALRAIRKRANFYKQMHCQQLADLVLPLGVVTSANKITPKKQVKPKKQLPQAGSWQFPVAKTV